MHLQVLYEDNHIIAVNKPAGYLAQGDKTGDTPMSEYVKGYIKKKYNKPGDVFLGVIHRLDRPVSGVIVYARTSKGLTRMNELFKNREAKKVYWAVSENQPDPMEGELTHFILKNKEKNKVKAFNAMSSRAKGGKKAELSYKMLGRVGSHILIEVKPKTGRPHQIRVQLSRLGSPIKGDVKYGATALNDNAGIHLHSRSLSFMHPIKKIPIEIFANPPKEDAIWNMFRGFTKR